MITEHLLNMTIKFTYITILCLLGFTHMGYSIAHLNLPTTDTTYSFTDVDIEPEPVKGMAKLYKQWNANALYPTEAKRNRIEGKVFIYFTVSETGEITETGVRKGIGYGCGQAALKAFNEVRLKWKPGIKDGKKASVQMILPFVFRLK